MLGLPNLKIGLAQLYKNSDAKQRQLYALSLADLFQWANNKDDYLFPFFHQSDIRFKQYNLELETHGVAWYFLKSKILRKECYMIYIETPEMAMPNNEISILEEWDIYGIKFNIDNSPQGTDGFVELTEELKLKELCLFEKEMPKSLKEIILQKGTRIPLEVGTNDICKMYQYLVPEFVGNKSVCRLPYDFGKGNRMAIFYCI